MADGQRISWMGNKMCAQGEKVEVPDIGTSLSSLECLQPSSSPLKPP